MNERDALDKDRFPSTPPLPSSKAGKRCFLGCGAGVLVLLSICLVFHAMSNRSLSRTGEEMQARSGNEKAITFQHRYMPPSSEDPEYSQGRDSLESVEIKSYRIPWLRESQREVRHHMLELKLATLDAGHPVEDDDPRIDQFVQVLDSLEGKCREPRLHIGIMLIVTSKKLAERDVFDHGKLLDIAQHLDESIPASLKNKRAAIIDEVAGAYIILRSPKFNP